MGVYVESAEMLPEKLRLQAQAKLKEQSRNKKRRNKYGSNKCQVNGISFDSEKEARRYLVLYDMLKREEISDLKLQHSFTLNESYTSPEGEKVGKIIYVADFTYFDKDGKFIIEDVKSEATAKNERYKVKKKLMASKKYYIREV